MTAARYRPRPRQPASNLARARAPDGAPDAADFSAGQPSVSPIRRSFRPHPISSIAAVLCLHVAEGGAEETLRDRELLAKLRDLPVPAESALRRLFDLTPAEARLARKLAGGDSLEQVAQALDVKMTTARSQLAAIFAKTGTCRQAQLVAILSRLAHLA